jgi:ribonuclease P protein component
MPGFVLQAAPAPADQPLPTVRVGFTVSKRVGNAIARNRVRRRLREIARQIIPGQARPDLDYVLVGRRSALTERFADLGAMLGEALRQTGDSPNSRRQDKSRSGGR